MKTQAWKIPDDARPTPSVVECGSPLPLSPGSKSTRGEQGARGLAQSKTWRRVVATLVFLVVVITAHAQSYSIDWFTIDGGGGTSTGGVYSVSGTIGQPDAGRVAATTAYRIEGGFWAIIVQQLGYPSLAITLNGANLLVSWETAEPGFILQSTTNLAAPAFWADSGLSVTTNGATNLVTFPIVPDTEKKFFRLRRP
jgi:hypothetical protein